MLHEPGSCTEFTVPDCSVTYFREELRRSDPINQVRVFVQSQSRVQQYDLWFCGAVKCIRLFLTHPTDWNKIMTSKNAQCSIWCKFWILQNRSLETVPICIVWQCLHMTIFFKSHVWCLKKIKRDNRLSQTLIHFVIDLASLSIQCKISGRQYVQEWALQNNWEHTFDNFSTDFNSSSLKWIIVNAWSWYFAELLSRLVCQLSISFHTFLDTSFRVIRPKRNTQIFRAWKFFSCSCRNFWFRHCSAIVHNIFAYFTLSLSTSQVNMIKERCWLSQNQFLCWVLSTSNSYFFFPSIWCHPHTQIRIIHFHEVRISIPNWKPSPNRTSQFKTFSQSCSNRTFSNCLSCSRMTAQISLKRNDWVFHIGPWFWPFVSW